MNSMRVRGKLALGMSLIEMLVATVIMGIAVAGITELAFTSAKWTNRYTNKLDVTFAARQVLERLGSEIRMARNVGDICATGTGINQFPSSNNPYYGSGQAPPGSPAGWPSMWPAPPYRLDNQTLILQVPIFDKNGMPTKLPSGCPSPANTCDRPNVDTIVYKIIPDPSAERQALGEYVLTRAVFLGVHDGSLIQNQDVVSRQPVNPPQTVLTGIVGPLDKTTGLGPPKVFHFIDKTNPGGTMSDTTTLSDVSLIRGVIINLELRKCSFDGKESSTCGFRTEYSFRNSMLGS